jgi:arylsulfatase
LVDQVNQSSKKERVLFFEHQGNRAVREGKWKLVAFDDKPWELYDFSNDRTAPSRSLTVSPKATRGKRKRKYFIIAKGVIPQ